MRNYSWPGNVRELENTIERALIIGQGTIIDVGDLPPENATPSTPPNASDDTEAAPEDLRAALRRYEQIHIRRVLQAAGGNRGDAARRLGIDASTLWRKLSSAGAHTDHADDARPPAPSTAPRTATSSSRKP